MYTLYDIIEKLILIEKDSMEMYFNIADKTKNSSIMISALSKTLVKQEYKHIQYYKNLMKEIKDEENTEIDFFLYDKAAKLLYEFRNSISLPDIENVYTLIKYAFDFEKKNVALLLDIQGRLVLNAQDSSNLVYKVISQMILEEKKHAKDLETYLTK